MKKLLLLVLVCGMYDGSFAQFEKGNDNSKKNDSEKWVTSANNLKTSTGRLMMDNPAGSKWTIYIYSMATNKYITSFNQSNNKGLFVLSPNAYKITINNAPVENVPVKKGYDTKLETGVLDINANAIWYLYDETGKTSYTSGNKPEKLVLPVGNYRITVNNAPIENVQVRKGPDTRLKTGVLNITENDVWYLYDETGKTSYTSGNKPEKLALPVGNYTLKVGNTSYPVVVSELSVENIKKNPDDAGFSEKWVITDLTPTKNTDIKNAPGILDLIFPDALYNNCPLTTPCRDETIENNIKWKIQITGNGSDTLFIAHEAYKKQVPREYSLPPGKYQINLNNITVSDVPIESNRKTRLKTGLLKLNIGGGPNPDTWYAWEIRDLETGAALVKGMNIQQNSSIVLPVNYYIVKLPVFKGDTIQIQDKQVAEFSQPLYPFTIESINVAWRIYNMEGPFNQSLYGGGQVGMSNPETTTSKTVYLPLGQYKLEYDGPSTYPITVIINVTTYIPTNRIRIP